MKSPNLTFEQVDRVVYAFLLKGRAPDKASETLVRKVAIGYPPAQELYAKVPVPSMPEHLHICLRTPGALKMVQMWYDVQSDFAKPSFVEYIHRHLRTKKWERPTVDHICRVLQTSPEILWEYVSAHFLKPGLVPSLHCPVPEWQ